MVGSLVQTVHVHDGVVPVQLQRPGVVSDPDTVRVLVRGKHGVGEDQAGGAAGAGVVCRPSITRSRGGTR